MSTTYLDASAAVKLIISEPESAALWQHLKNQPGLRLVASWLLYTELHCAVGRSPNDIDAERVEAVLQRIVLADISREDLIVATSHVGLRSNDAIHLAVARRLGVTELLTYDRELAAAAAAAGLSVLSPGSEIL